jgi:hypothetical protein
MTDDFTPSAWMMLRCLFRRVFRLIRFQMIDDMITPYNLKARMESKCTIVVSLKAKSDYADSPIIRVKISWDGGWEDGELEMRRHIEIKPL